MKRQIRTVFVLTRQRPEAAADILAVFKTSRTADKALAYMQHADPAGHYDYEFTEFNPAVPQQQLGVTDAEA